MAHMLLGVFLILLLTKTAQAYIDPGTGSYVFQLLLGLLFGIALAWQRVFGALIRGVKFLVVKFNPRKKITEQEENLAKVE